MVLAIFMARAVLFVWVHHCVLYAVFSHSFLLKHMLLFEFILNLVSRLHEDIEELFAFLLHVFLILVYENWFHDHFVKSVHVFSTTLINMPFLMLMLFVGMKHVLIA